MTRLRALAEEGEGVADWSHGATLINDSHWQDYARELAEELGGTDGIPSWVVVDWDATADNLRADYTTVEWEGKTFYVR